MADIVIRCHKKKEKSSLSLSNFADFLALDIVGGYFDSALLSPSCRTTKTMRRRNSGLPVCKAEFLVLGAGMTAAMMFWHTSAPVRIPSHFSPRGCSLVMQRHSGVVARMRGFNTVSRRSGAKVSFAFFRFGGLLRVRASKIFSDIFRFQGLFISKEFDQRASSQQIKRFNAQAKALG
jgi:hypothetical protein